MSPVFRVDMDFHVVLEIDRLAGGDIPNLSKIEPVAHDARLCSFYRPELSGDVGKGEGRVRMW